MFMNSEVIQKVNFFQFADPSFILIVSKCLKPKLTLESNYIVYQGEVATQMYFIKSGIVQILSTDNKTVIAYMSEGTYFGEIGILITEKRTCFVKAKTPCVLFTINGEELIKILEKYPLIYKFLKAVANQRLQTTAPEDLIEQDKEFDSMAEKQVSKKQRESKRELGSMFEIRNRSSSSGSLMKSGTEPVVLEKEDLKIKFWLTEEYKYYDNFIIIPFSR